MFAAPFRWFFLLLFALDVVCAYHSVEAQQIAPLVASSAQPDLPAEPQNQDKTSSTSQQSTAEPGALATTPALTPPSTSDAGFFRGGVMPILRTGRVIRPARRFRSSNAAEPLRRFHRRRTRRRTGRSAAHR